MSFSHRAFSRSRSLLDLLLPAAVTTIVVALSACAPSTVTTNTSANPMASSSAMPPTPDPRVGLRAGLYDAAEAVWNLHVLSETRPSEKFAGGINSDLAFLGNYAIQGSFSGYQVWDISNPRAPTLKEAYFCPASQSDVSVYRNLLFVSGEDLTARIDCGAQGVKDTVSKDRLRGIRIFDISDISNPRNVGNVQTCRGSHTHSLLVDPKDPDNVYVYISGSAGVRSPNELPGCSSLAPDKDPNSALFRIEVIKVPLAHPELAAVVTSPRIFQGLTAPPRHGETAVDIAEAKKEIDAAKARGAYTAMIFGEERVLPDRFVAAQLDSIVRARHGTGAPTAADSAVLRRDFQSIVSRMVGDNSAQGGTRPGPSQCHDITLYPAIGRAGGACGGYGLLLDITDPAHPVRLSAAADSNFSYWHSATFNNDGTKILFSDEWGGGTQPKCRTTDPREWGADAIFTIAGSALDFRSYYKLPAPQTRTENCVAHNGSLIPIPGRDVMVQAWYQGGISVFDWTDAAHPREIAYFDRGPVDSTALKLSGSWSAYWYNGVIVSSEITRGLDIFELAPSAFISQNEINAAKSVRFAYYNTQGQQKFVWPASVALAGAYIDQLERSNGLPAARIVALRQALGATEHATASERQSTLTSLVAQLQADANASRDASKVRALAETVQNLARGEVALQAGKE